MLWDTTQHQYNWEPGLHMYNLDKILKNEGHCNLPVQITDVHGRLEQRVEF